MFNNYPDMPLSAFMQALETILPTAELTEDPEGRCWLDHKKRSIPFEPTSSWLTSGQVGWVCGELEVPMDDLYVAAGKFATAGAPRRANKNEDDAGELASGEAE